VNFMRKPVAGTLLFVGGVQFALCLILSETVYPGYNVSVNVISDLGVWSKPSAIIFDPSTIIFGLTILAASFLIQKEFKMPWLSIMLALAGLGAMGVGLFPENILKFAGHAVIHDASAITAFFFGGVAAISAYRITKSPFKYFSVILGAVALLSMVLFAVTAQFDYLGIGIGGMERMIVYPTLVWTIGLGGYLMQTSNVKINF
jgi:hypothetical membrane protein